MAGDKGRGGKKKKQIDEEDQIGRGKTPVRERIRRLEAKSKAMSSPKQKMKERKKKSDLGGVSRPISCQLG